MILLAAECSKPDQDRAFRLGSVLSGATPGERE